MKLSAVVQLIDGFRAQPAVGCRARFLFDHAPVQPLAKPDAFYAFGGLAAGAHRLTVEADGFFPREVTLQVPMAEPLADAIVACDLAPSPLYPYPAGTTLLRGLVGDGAQHGQALAGVAVLASYANLRGTAIESATRTDGRGSYAGRYALALRGQMAPGATVELRFSKAGYADVRRSVQVSTGAMQFVDVVLQSS
jgi:hypothetical protein